MDEENNKDKFKPAILLGKLGGASKSDVKVRAARENGMLGGRPRGSKKLKPSVNPQVDTGSSAESYQS